MGALTRLIAWMTAFCVAHARFVAIGITAVALAAAWFAAGRFQMSTDTEALLSPKLPFRQYEQRFDAAFPHAEAPVIAVIDAATPEGAALTSRRLVEALRRRPDLFTSVRDPQDTPFFRQNGLLYLSPREVRDAAAQMIEAQPFMASVARDPSFRGVLDSLSTAAAGVSAGETTLDGIAKPIHGMRVALEQAERGGSAAFSWRELITDKAATPGERRRLLLIDPKLDYSSLQPADGPVGVVRSTARALDLDEAHGVSVRLTGPAVLADEEFATLSEHMGLIAGLMVAAIVLMLWFAVRSVKTILCILASTLAGLVFAAALGLALFGEFNVISVAFIPLFVGLGIDFGIQYAVRFRAEQRGEATPDAALMRAANGIGGSLTLAATAISAGFLTFLPTRYVGVSQLGAIAGLGLILALALTVTFLPALLKLANPRGKLPDLGAPQLEKVDAFILGRRRLVLAIGGGLALACFALMPLLRFDFNPMHLRSAKTESVSTLLDLIGDPDQSVNVVNVLAPSLPAAQPVAARLAALPEVSSVVTLADFVPDAQDEKLAVIQDASFLLDMTLNPFDVQPPPSDAQIVSALNDASAKLRVAVSTEGDGLAAPEAERLAEMLMRLARGAPADRARAGGVVVPGLLVLLDDMRMSLTAQKVTRETLPADLARDWIAPDGRARIMMKPKGDSNDNAMLRRFAKAVHGVAPDATGAPISIQQSGQAIVTAFLVAGALSFVAITLILFVALRRTIDVLITLAPIALTALLTLGCAVALNDPLNFANVIALPLLFGIGVAFHIYFVMAWRSGEGHLLQSSLARGVFFSALTTGTGFGSLWLSSHPGTASMGKLLMISLVWTLVSALLFQPALMGRAPAKIAAARRASAVVDAAPVAQSQE